MKEIKAYRCDFCKKYSCSKGVITKHERSCYHNPVTRACATCKNMIQICHPIFVDVDIMLSRYLPACLKGIELTDNTNITLKNHCPSWELKTYENETGEG